MSALETSKITLGMFDSSDIPSLLRIWGGEGERDSGDQPDDEADVDDEDVDDEQEDDEDEQENDEDEAKSKKSKKKSEEKSLEEQLDEEKRLRLKAERKLARQNKDQEAAEADKDAIKDRDKYKAKLEARDNFLRDNLLLMEINKQSKFQFVDPEDVVTALRTKYADEIEIDLESDVPSVDGLDLALKRIAKEKPHFLKPKKSKDDDDDEDEQQPSGPRVGGGRKESQDAEDKRLGEKFKLPGYGTQTLRAL